MLHWPRAQGPNRKSARTGTTCFFGEGDENTSTQLVGGLTPSSEPRGSSIIRMHSKTTFTCRRQLVACMRINCNKQPPPQCRCSGRGGPAQSFHECSLLSIHMITQTARSPRPLRRAANRPSQWIHTRHPTSSHPFCTSQIIVIF